MITRGSPDPSDHIGDPRSIARIKNGRVSVLSSNKRRDKRVLRIRSPLARMTSILRLMDA